MLSALARYLFALLLVGSQAFAAGPIFWGDNIDASTTGVTTDALTLDPVVQNPATYVAIDHVPTENGGVQTYSVLYDHANLNPVQTAYYGVRLVPSLTGNGSGETYTGVLESPTLASYGGDYIGVSIDPTVTTSGNAFGLNIDMGSVTASGTKLGLVVNGDSSMGKVSTTTSVTAVDALPNTVHNWQETHTVEADAAITGYNAYSLVVGQWIDAGTDSDVTSSNPFGFSALSPSSTVDLDGGSTVDYVNGVSAYAMATGTGAVTNIAAYRATLLDSTPLATNAYGFVYSEPFGDVLTTNKYAFYSDVPTAKTRFGGEVQIREDTGTGGDHYAKVQVPALSADVTVKLPRISSTVIGSIALVDTQTGTAACEAAFGGSGAGSCLGCKAEGNSAAVACNVAQDADDLFCACLGDIP